MVFNNKTQKLDSLCEAIMITSFTWASNRDSHLNFSWLDWICNPSCIRTL